MVIRPPPLPGSDVGLPFLRFSPEPFNNDLNIPVQISKIMKGYHVIVEPKYIAHANSEIYVIDDSRPLAIPESNLVITSNLKENQNKSADLSKMRISAIRHGEEVLQFPHVCACCGSYPSSNIELKLCFKANRYFESTEWTFLHIYFLNGQKIPYCDDCLKHVNTYRAQKFPSIFPSRYTKLMKQSCTNPDLAVKYIGPTEMELSKIPIFPNNNIPPLKVEIDGDPSYREILYGNERRKFHEFIFSNYDFAKKFANLNEAYLPIVDEWIE